MATTTNDYLDGATVLIAESDESRRRRLATAFERAGATVVSAPSDHDGAWLDTHQADLVVVDVDAGGAELAMHLKSSPLTSGIPVIQRSASPIDDGDVVRGLYEGADAYLADPISEAVIVATGGALLRTRDLARRLEVALSSATSGVFDWNIETGRVRWNESLERLHGMQPGEFGGTLDDFRQSVHPDDRERVETELADAVASGDDFTIAFRFLRTDGSVGHMEGQGRLFRSNLGEAVRMLGLAQDVTERVASRMQVEQFRRLATRLSALRTPARVLEALEEELGGNNARIDLVGPDDPVADGVVFSFAVLDGRLDVVWTDRPGGVTRRQAIAIGELAGSALDRALRFEAERNNARTLQTALQPQSAPHVDGFGLDAVYVPASATDRLGGDFFDVLEIDDVFVVTVGDVAGHGLPATRQMGAIRAMLRTIAASNGGDPVATIDVGRSLFEAVCGAGSPFATVLMCQVEKTTGEVTVGSAGHPPPLFGRAGGDASLVDLRPAPPLGVNSAERAAPSRFVLAPGDWLAVYTDGVFERRDVPLDEAVGTAVRGLDRAPSAYDLLDAGEAAAGATDDRALVVVERRLPGAETR